MIRYRTYCAFSSACVPSDYSGQEDKGFRPHQPSDYRIITRGGGKMPFITRVPHGGALHAKYPIFLSYRRTDAGGYVFALFRDLVARFGENVAFYDKDSIDSGTVFAEHIDEAIRNCKVLLAVISRDWLAVTDNFGNRRLDEPEDPVCREVALALELGTKVIPVLFEVDKMPEKHRLPDPLKPLAGIDFLHLRGKVFEYDVQLAKLANMLAAIPGMPKLLGARLRRGQGAGVMPDKLPYLCNRSEQESEVRGAVRQHLQKRSKRPLVLVIHGQSDESHGAFVDRLAANVVPRVIGASAPEVSFLQIKHALTFHIGKDAFARELRYRIASEMQIDDFERDDELWELLPRLPLRAIAPVITIRSEESGSDAASALRRLYEYWSAFPDAPEQRLTACVLCVMYESAANAGFFHRWRRRSADKALRQAVEASGTEFAEVPGLSWKVIPELHSVRFSHVYDWAWGEDVRVALKRDLMSSALRTAFGTREPIPMDEAIEKMRTLLEPQGI